MIQLFIPIIYCSSGTFDDSVLFRNLTTLVIANYSIFFPSKINCVNLIEAYALCKVYLKF